MNFATVHIGKHPIVVAMTDVCCQLLELDIASSPVSILAHPRNNFHILCMDRKPPWRPDVSASHLRSYTVDNDRRIQGLHTGRELLLSFPPGLVAE